MLLEQFSTRTRCNRTFVSRVALIQHKAYSGRHHECSRCGHDADGRSDLLDHYRDSGCFTVCEGCLNAYSKENFINHCRSSHVCRKCHKHFKHRGAILNHWKDTGHITLCKTCHSDCMGNNEWLKHCRDSHACAECHIHYPNRQTLINHWRETRHLKLCEGCLSGCFEKYWRNHQLVNYACERCHKHHSCNNDLEQHWKDTGHEMLCPGCHDRTSPEKFLKHCREKNACDECYVHEKSRAALLDHWRATRHRIVCEGCLLGVQPEHWTKHCREHHVCPECHCHQQNENNLAHHMMVHLPVDIECWGCERMFSTFSGMIIHLERGSCPSGINAKDLNESAAMCYQWSHFIYGQYRICLLSRKHDDGCGCTPDPFKCPDCDISFPHLSALFQHAGTRSCDQELDKGAIGKLVHWLKSRHA